MENSSKRKRLPKELQDYKKEVKALPFKDRVKAYFNCSTFTNDIDKYKKEIILKSFSKKEKEEYYRRYYPIYTTIERYGDKIRAINGNRIIYGNHMTIALSQRDTISYTADILNLILPEVAGALKATKEEDTKKKLTEALRLLKRYRRVSSNSPEIKYNEKKGSYEVPTKESDKFLMGVIETLKGLLSLLKCYLESLKEFLEWVGYPELLPREFYDMETDLLIHYKAIPLHTDKNPDADRLPLFFAENEVAKEFLSIDYKALPRTIDIFKDKNPFANYYRSLFKY